MKCYKAKKQLFLLVGDDLPDRKKKSVESHLKHCPACMDQLEELKKMKENLREISRSDLPHKLHPDFPEKVINSMQPARAKSPFWLLSKPVHVVGILSLAIILIGLAMIIFHSSGKVTSDRLIEKILSISGRGSSDLEWDPEHIFFKTFDGPHRLDNWEAPKQSGVYAVLHKTTSDEGSITYTIDYCGQGRNLSSYRGYPWIHHRIKRLVARTGATENVYIAVFLMPDSSKVERRQIEEALVKTFNPYFNRGV